MGVGTGSAGILLEREREIAVLRAHLEEARSGAGRMVLLDGPAGIGKTSLLRVVAEEAAPARLLTARGSEPERGYAFGVVRQLLEPVVCDGAGHELLAGPAAPARAILDPPSGALRPGAADAGALHGLFWLVAHLTESGPLVLSVDDAQWIDPGSLRFLAHLAVRLDGLPVLGALAARPPDPSTPAAFGRLAQAPGVDVLPVGPLGAPAAGELVSAVLGACPRELCDACHAATGGNPFLLGALAAELGRTQQGAESDPEIVRLLAPPEIVRSVRLRLEALGPEPRALAGAAAVLGDPVDLAAAAALAGLGVDAAARAADALVAAALLEPGRPLRFAHPLVLSAIGEGIAPADRVALHRRAALLLAREPADLDAAAGHLLAADPAGDGDSVDVLLRAAAVARSRGASDSAEAYLRRAMAEPPDPARAPAVLLALASAAVVAGAPDALELAEAAHAANPPGPARLQAAIEAGHLHNLDGRAALAARMVEEALAADGIPAELREAAEALLLAWAQTSLDVHRAMADRTAAALATVERLGDAAPITPLGPLALHLAGTTATAAEAAALAERALAGGVLLRRHTSDTPLPHMAAAALVTAGRWAEAERAFEDVLVEARGRGSVRGFAAASAMRSWTRLWRGDLRGAEADAHACLEVAEESGIIVILASFALSSLADVRCEMGDLDTADAVLERMPAPGRSPSSNLAMRWFEARARLRLGQGRPRDALVELQTCAEWERAWGAVNGAWCGWRPLAVEARLALGQSDAAAAVAAEAVALGRAFGAPRQLGLALRAAALAGDPGGRPRALAAAETVLAAGGSELELTRTQVDRGEALLAAGDDAPARDVLGEALRRAERAGAAVLETRARTALVQAGARPRRRRTSGAAALTPAERRIADLAARGRPNQEIAATLFLTTKTVENHLTSTYRKLGIGSRTQLAEHLA